MSNSRNVTITHWINNKPIAELTVWPVGDGKDRHAELDGRMTVSIYTGTCNVSLKPTADEARKLIDALQWALESEKVPA